MVTDATKKYREFIAYGLLAVGGLYFIGSLSLLFKSDGAGFADKSALVGDLFESPVPVVSLVVAALLVTRFGELSANARVVLLAALSIGGLDLLFGVITFFAQFGAGQGFGSAGIPFSGKVVGVVLGLAHLLFLGAGVGYVYTAFQGLPAPVAPQQAQWGADRGFAQYGPGGGQQTWDPPGQGYPPGGQPAWGPQASPYGWASPDQAHAQQQAWPQPPAQPQQTQGGWGQPPQGYGPASAPQIPWPTPEPAAPTSAWGQPPIAYDDTPQAREWDRAEEIDDPATTAIRVAPDQVAETEAEVGSADDSAEAPPADTPDAGKGWWQHPQQ